MNGLKENNFELPSELNDTLVTLLSPDALVYLNLEGVRLKEDPFSVYLLYPNANGIVSSFLPPIE